MIAQVVGVAGFEPTAFRSQSGRATKLRHTPSGATRRVHARRQRGCRISRAPLGTGPRAATTNAPPGVSKPARPRPGAAHLNLSPTSGPSRAGPARGKLTGWRFQGPGALRRRPRREGAAGPGQLRQPDGRDVGPRDSQAGRARYGEGPRPGTHRAPTETDPAGEARILQRRDRPGTAPRRAVPPGGSLVGRHAGARRHAGAGSWPGTGPGALGRADARPGLRGRSRRGRR